MRGILRVNTIKTLQHNGCMLNLFVLAGPFNEPLFFSWAAEITRSEARATQEERLREMYSLVENDQFAQTAAGCSS